MKRSQINQAIVMTKKVLKKNKFYLPEFCYWSPEKWQIEKHRCQNIIETGLGWDITDFGYDNFDKIGAVIVTLRNGNQMGSGTPYAEKIIVLKEEQMIPMHYHFTKTEDIINRGSGVLRIKIFASQADGAIDHVSKVSIDCDGFSRKCDPGCEIDILPGGSITLRPHLYHAFWAKKGEGILVCGEVSSVNNDNNDNRFAENTKRFADIIEDEDPVCLLCNEYTKVLIPS